MWLRPHSATQLTTRRGSKIQSCHPSPGRQVLGWDTKTRKETAPPQLTGWGLGGTTRDASHTGLLGEWQGSWIRLVDEQENRHKKMKVWGITGPKSGKSTTGRRLRPRSACARASRASVQPRARQSGQGAPHPLYNLQASSPAKPHSSYLRKAGDSSKEHQEHKGPLTGVPKAWGMQCGQAANEKMQHSHMLIPFHSSTEVPWLDS